MKSIYWRPYADDEDTLGLFHLDRERAVSEEEVETETAKPNTAKQPQEDVLLAETTEEEASGIAVADASRLRRNARLVGSTEWVERGVLDGALRLKGKGSALCTPPYAELREGAFTIECWVRPEAAPKEPAVLGALESTRPNKLTYELRYLPEARLELLCLGKSLGKSQRSLEPGKWQHVSMIFTGAAPPEESGLPQNVIALFIMGELDSCFEGEYLESARKDLSGAVRVGNDRGGDAPFLGEIDEVRVSAKVRMYYVLDTAWTDPAGTRTVVADQPYLRQARDVTMYVPFDGKPEPEFATEGTTCSGSLSTGTPAPRAAPVAFRYAEGVRGKAIVVGPDCRMPVYSATGNFNPERGAVEFWFRPYDWDNRKPQGMPQIDPMEFVPLLRVVAKSGRTRKHPAELLTLRALHKRAADARKPAKLDPGHWYHLVANWSVGGTTVYLNGLPVPDSTIWCTAVRGEPGEKLVPDKLFLDPITPNVLYLGEHTLIDELRVYSRPLTSEEAWNAYARFFPQPDLKPLPFAHVYTRMSGAEKAISGSVEVLGPKWSEVATATLSVSVPEAKTPLARYRIESFADGSGEFKMAPVEFGFGPHRFEFTFFDKDGRTVGQCSATHDRVRPPWLGSTVGMHDKVLPGWTPMEASGKAVRLWGREIVIGGSGIPERIISQGENMLAEPIRVSLISDGKRVQLMPEAEAPTIEKATETVVVTRGAMIGGGWRLETRITTEFDGLMKVESTLSGKAPVNLFRIEIPLNRRNATLMGFWSGDPNFRWSTFYDLLPESWGAAKSPSLIICDALSIHPLTFTVSPHRDEPLRQVCFRSNQIWCSYPPLTGSFIPLVILADDERALTWFAENDRGWTKSKTVPAVEVYRLRDEVTLRLNIIHLTTTLSEPQTFVFGLHPSPVKPLPEDWRSAAGQLSFALADSFSGELLKGEGEYASFWIFPEDYDWAAAKRRADKYMKRYPGGWGFGGPFLYIDRNWVGIPPDASEYAGVWWRSGKFRYLPEARNCYLWNIDQWLKHKLIKGVYIDDCWIGDFTDPETGPAYKMPNGKVQPGYEFFDFHEFMKRLRWVFHDNGERPWIWCHMTHTLYMPCLSFAEVMLDGEDRFLRWGADADFMDMWPPGRLRFNNGAKWGVIPHWFVKIGGDDRPTVPMPHWQYHQTRSYAGACVVNDIVTMGVPSDVWKGGFYDDRAKFVGYWSPENPAKCEPENIHPSFWIAEGRTVAMIVNRNKDAVDAKLELDPAKLGFPGATIEDLIVKDIDTYDPPKGEDIRKVEVPKAPTEKVEEKDDFLEALEETEPEKGGRTAKPLGDHDFRWDGGRLALRIRGHDYRILSFVTKKK